MGACVCACVRVCVRVVGLGAGALSSNRPWLLDGYLQVR